MDAAYKDVSNLGKETPLQWDRFNTLISTIEKKLQNYESEPPLEITPNVEFELTEICSKFHFSIVNADLESTKIWIHQFYSYSYQNVISDLQELHSNFIIPDINIIIANEVNVFDLEMRQKAIEIIYNLINTTTEVSEVFLHCNTIQLLSDFIIGNDELSSLHFSALKCIRKFSSHCENCQERVCECFPLNFFEKHLSTLSDDRKVDRFHIEIFSIFKSVSKFELHPELIEYIFNIFDYFIDFSDDILTICLLGIFNLTKIQDPLFWSAPLKKSRLPIILSNSLNHHDFTISQSTLLLIASIYKQKQEIPHFNLGLIIDKLHYKDEENLNQNSLVRYYASATLYEIIKGDKEYIHIIIANHFLDAFKDVFDDSPFDVKFELIRSLEEIAINGYPADKLELIKNNFIHYFIEMIEIGNDEQIVRLIDSLGNLFAIVLNDPNNQKICFESFRNTPNNIVIKDCAMSPFPEVSGRAIQLLSLIDTIYGKISNVC